MARAEPVRVYADEDRRLPRRLATELEKRISGYSETIISGSLTFDRYQNLTGLVAGLREALQMAEDLSKELSGD
jgi:hypothetical protein